MDSDILKTISRIKATQDGVDFLKFLSVLSINNYKAFKASPVEMNDIHKGQAIAIDAITELFENCDTILREREEQEKTNVMINPFD